MLKHIALAALLTLGFSTATLGQQSHATGSSNHVSTMTKGAFAGPEAERALARLGDLSLPAVRERLAQLRPPAYLPGPVLINKIIEQQHLPVASSDRVSRLKAALRPVLAYHGRDQMPVIVARSEQPKAYLVERAAIIITTNMMLITSEAEMRGIIAHELAHECLWDERARARKEDDQSWLREIELFCDAVAAITLKEIGDDPADYARALERLTSVGITAGNATRHESKTHPSLDARLKLNQWLCQRLGSTSVIAPRGEQRCSLGKSSSRLADQYHVD